MTNSQSTNIFDYIVVGAGAAGCVVANRLTEDSQVTVLLLEAGGPDKAPELHVPAAYSRAFKTRNDWVYFTEPQVELERRQVYWPRGKVMGGSTSMNAMIYIRGNRADYDQWRELGNVAWSYQDVLPYFVKAEDQERGSSDYHGTGGPLSVVDRRYVNPMTYAFMDAAGQCGYAENADFNGPSQDGYGYYQVNQKNGQRHSAVDAYLKPVLKRSNLSLKTQVLTTSISIEGGRAVGVSFIENGKQQSVRAAREVIICGGAINSPQLLMLSGIGPAAALEALDIPVVLDLPGVGQNLQDHVGIAVAFSCTVKGVSLESAQTIPNMVSYMLFKQGPFTSNIVEAGLFVRASKAVVSPDVQIGFIPAYAMDNGFARLGSDAFSIGVNQLKPLSRGCVKLRSSNPSDHPVVDPQYLSVREDIQPLVDGIRLAREIGNATAFDLYRGVEVQPGPDTRTDEEIISFIRRWGQSSYHPVGTCKMGIDPLAVVDPELRVRGITGLRVVDASVMPTIISGNTNAPTVMIAEKGAELISHS